METGVVKMGAATMSSLQIAELTGKRHKDVMRAIRTMEPAWVKVSGRNFALSKYRDSTGRTLLCYELSKTECLYVATKFNDEARAKLVLRWEELETEARGQAWQVPQTFSSALLLAAKLQEEVEEQQKMIEAKEEQISVLTNKVTEMTEKVSYLDAILRNPSTSLTTSIAQDWGMCAAAFNKLLHEIGIQRRVNKQWILYAPYISGGYVHSEPVEIELSDGQKKIRYQTKWTQKGRLFLYEKLKAAGFPPLIERN